MIFKRKKQVQPARTEQLRQLLEKAYTRSFSDAEIRDAAITVNEFLPLLLNPDLALQTGASPRQLLFALAATGNDLGLSIRAAIQGIAATAARKGN
jgi:hypothetical protein